MYLILHAAKENYRTAYGSEGEEETIKTPTFSRVSKLFGFPLADAACYSPRSWSNKVRRFGESVEGQLESEEALLNQLKRAVRLDRKSLMSLYMELDEERSAAAIAASNAMAMITRLQEEKASVQMEALQYQRMMEEQTEYDEEALQAATELLTKREDEIKALEAELAIYREKHGCLSEDEFQNLIDFHDESEEFRFQPNLSQAGTASSQMFSENEDSEVKGYNFPQSVLAQVDSEESRSKSNHLNQINKTDTRNHVGDDGFQFPSCTSDSTSFVVNDAGNMKHNTPTHKFSN